MSKSITDIKKEFGEEYVNNGWWRTGDDHPSNIDADPKRVWDFFESKLKQEYQRGCNDVVKEVEIKFKNAENRLKETLTLALIKQIIFELKRDILHSQTNSTSAESHK